jgi:hypothetical protein
VVDYGTGRGTGRLRRALIELAPQWARYAVLFNQMGQEPAWGDRAQELSTNAIFAVEWQWSTPGSEFDIWVDNVELVGCE